METLVVIGIKMLTYVTVSVVESFKNIAVMVIIVASESTDITAENIKVVAYINTETTSQEITVEYIVIGMSKYQEFLRSIWIFYGILLLGVMCTRFLLWCIVFSVLFFP